MVIRRSICAEISTAKCVSYCMQFDSALTLCVSTEYFDRIDSLSIRNQLGEFAVNVDDKPNASPY